MPNILFADCCGLQALLYARMLWATVTSITTHHIDQIREVIKQFPFSKQFILFFFFYAFHYLIFPLAMYYHGIGNIGIQIRWQYGIKNKAAIAFSVNQCQMVKIIAALFFVLYSLIWGYCQNCTMKIKDHFEPQNDL